MGGGERENMCGRKRKGEGGVRVPRKRIEGGEERRARERVMEGRQRGEGKGEMEPREGDFGWKTGRRTYGEWTEAVTYGNEDKEGERDAGKENKCVRGNMRKRSCGLFGNLTYDITLSKD